MLAMARILRTGARLLLLDEISPGFGPVTCKSSATLIRTLRAKGFTVVLVEQNFGLRRLWQIGSMSWRAVRIVKQFERPELDSQMGCFREYLGV